MPLTLLQPRRAARRSPAPPRAQLQLLGLHDEMIVDLFAGGGGASTGIEVALGRQVDVAVNHDPAAVALHAVNHPQTRHETADVFEVCPHSVTQGRPVGLLWASPDCTFHSKARGGKPIRSGVKKRRALAWVVTRWAGQVRPRVIMLENVEEFAKWGPLVGPPDALRPCPKRKGKTFRRWVRSLTRLPRALAAEVHAARDAEAECAELRADVEALGAALDERDAELIELRKRLWFESGGEPLTLVFSPGFRGLTLPSA